MDASIVCQKIHKDRADLRTRGDVLRQEHTIAAGDDALGDRPAHRLNGVAADACTVGVSGQNVLRDGGRLDIAVQEGRDLLAGDGSIGRKARGADAVDDAVL